MRTLLSLMPQPQHIIEFKIVPILRVAFAFCLWVQFSVGGAHPMIILHGLYDFNVSYTAASDAMHAPRLLMFSGYVLTMPASTTLGRFLGIRSRISRIWAPANNRYVGTYLNIQRFPLPPQNRSRRNKIETVQIYIFKCADLYLNK